MPETTQRKYLNFDKEGFLHCQCGNTGLRVRKAHIDTTGTDVIAAYCDGCETMMAVCMYDNPDKD